MKRRLPITIVSGFLGAGKTTILSNLINKSGESRLAVLVNEFGAVSIDQEILKKQTVSKTAEFIKITNSLVAYAGDEQFDHCMRLLRDRTDVDHVLIETSGLAVPSAAIEKLLLPEFREDFVLDATLLVIDTPVLLKGVTGPLAEVFKSQLECSDVAILNKIDNLKEEEFLKAETIIRGFAPNVRFIELAYQAQIDERVALGLRLNEPTFGDISSRVALSSKGKLTQQNGHDHSGLGPHEHGLLTHQHIHEHDPGWISFVLSTDEVQDRQELLDTLRSICESDQVFRVKGTAFVQGTREKLLYQAVGARVTVGALEPADHRVLEPAHSHQHLHEYEHSPVHTHDHSQGHVHEHDHGHSHDPGDEAHGELVFIGYLINRKNICTKLEECTHTGWY
jgi:cobalamin biosynthesis protein CobW